MAELLNVGTSSLLAYQKALATTGHNIANVNTEGYSRQSLTLDTRAPSLGAGGYVGSGVEVSTVARAYDSFLSQDLRANHSSFHHLDTFTEMTKQLEDLLADSDRGVSVQLENLFAAVQDLSNNPSSIPERQALLGEANALTRQIQEVDNALESLNSRINDQLQGLQLEVNSLAEALATINSEIEAAQARGGGQPPNDLLDTRDRLLKELSEYTGVVSSFQDGGIVNVTVGSGQILVVGPVHQSISLSPGIYDPLSLDLNVRTQDGSRIPITDTLTGGRMYGLLRFREEVLEPTRQELGLLAVGITETFNAQHELGLDLNGAAGGSFFTAVAPTVAEASTNRGAATATATISDASALQPADYRLQWTGATWELTNTSTGDTQNAADGAFNVDGLAIAVGGGVPELGDSFLVRPYFRAASAMDVALSRASDVAASAPLVSSESVSNKGSALVDGPTNTTMIGIPLATDITLTYRDNAAGFGPGFEVIGGPGGVILFDPTTESAGKTFTFENFGNASFTVSGTPEDGDTFTISNNTSGAGDNRNALLLGALQTEGSLLDSTANYQEVFAGTIGEVGIQVRQAEAALATQTALRNQSEQALSALAGVNLDEEAANLLRFQQAYQASAQVISTANELFQSLIAAFR
jgi:flagellar hook-associated protein 1 FlgK